MKEAIIFPEEEIPNVVRIMRKGLIYEPVESILHKELEKQCKELEDYWNGTCNTETK